MLLQGQSGYQQGYWSAGEGGCKHNINKRKKQAQLLCQQQILLLLSRDVTSQRDWAPEEAE